jgi:feruloyl esterase
VFPIRPFLLFASVFTVVHASENRCAALRQLTGFEFTVATAELVPASEGVAAHCRVTGQILPEIRFEVTLPGNWNKRFLMLGNGGYAGSLDLRGLQNGAGMGYATAATDTGHDAAVEPSGTFAQNRQKLYDYAFRSLHTTAEAAKRIVVAYYGTAPSKSFFQGCSTGGRQGLILAQRFPADFDGIVAGAPVLNFTGTMLRFLATMRALAKAPVPYAKLALIASRVYEKCDARDGVKDGIIDDPRRCDFSPARDLPRCSAADQPDCFTAAQIGALEKIYGPVLSEGRIVAPGWPVGVEATGPSGRSGWDQWIVRETPGPTISAGFAESFFKYLAFPAKDPAGDAAAFDFDRDAKRLAWIHSILDATDPDLSAFRSRRGKLIMSFGWADQALNPLEAVNYYETVQKTMGPGVPDFFRFFLVPGMFHCGGGPGCSTFDMLGPLVEWVEHAKAPDRVLSSKIEGGKTVRTRPLCPYPQAAKYKGTGSTDDAANFVCSAQGL